MPAMSRVKATRRPLASRALLTIPAALAPRRCDRNRRKTGESDDGIEHHRGVFGGAGEGAVHLTRIPGQRHREVRREAGRRADADDPAECSRDAHRAAEIRPLRDRQHPACDGSGGAAGGSGGAQGGVPRIACCPEHRIDGVGASGEFGRVGLGEHDRASGFQSPDDLGIFGRDIVGIKRAAVSRPDIRGRNDVLDADRQAMQRSQFVAAQSPPVPPRARRPARYRRPVSRSRSASD